MQKVKVKDFLIGDSEKLTFICGPCVIESLDHTLFLAKMLKEVFAEFDFNFIFKASFDKANRSSINSFRGPGLEKGLDILNKVKEELDLAVLTDIHLPSQAKPASEVCDILQIPAFLSRQTDLLVSAAKTQKPINVKKAQFMSPYDMKNVVEKIKACGNENIILTDRGTSFGYNNLVSDFRSIPIMKKFGYPICFDASHSIQLPGGLGSSSGGQKEFIPHLAKASVVVGANLLFIECHNDAKNAKSDSATVMEIENLKTLLKEIEKIYEVIKLEPSLC